MTRRPQRAKTLRVPRSGRVEGPELDTPPAPYWRPKTRAECRLVPRPCPFIGCKWNLYLDVSPKTGSIKLNFPELEPHEMVVSCALDIADQGPHGAEEIAGWLNVTREAIRQIELKAERKAFHLPVLRAIAKEAAGG